MKNKKTLIILAIVVILLIVIFRKKISGLFSSTATHTGYMAQGGRMAHSTHTATSSSGVTTGTSIGMDFRFNSVRKSSVSGEYVFCGNSLMLPKIGAQCYINFDSGGSLNGILMPNDPNSATVAGTSCLTIKVNIPSTFAYTSFGVIRF